MCYNMFARNTLDIRLAQNEARAQLQDPGLASQLSE